MTIAQFMEEHFARSAQAEKDLSQSTGSSLWFDVFNHRFLVVKGNQASELKGAGQERVDLDAPLSFTIHSMPKSP